MTTTPEPKPDRAALAILYLTVFLDLLGFGLIIPFLPFYAMNLGAAGLGMGLLLTSYSLGQLVGSAVLGRLSDRFGRRPILLISLAGAAIGTLLSGVATTLWWLCAARTLAGVFGGSISAAQAYVADVTNEQERAKYMGLIGAAIGLGFVLGPALGVGLEALFGLGFQGAAFAAAGLGLGNWILAIFLLREPPRHFQPAAKKRLLAALASAFQRPKLRNILIATFFTSYAFVTMETTFALLGAQRHGLDERDFGLILVAIGVVFVLVQGGLIGTLTTRFGVGRVAQSGDFLMAVALLLLPAVPTTVWVVLSLALLAAAQGLAVPTLSTLTSQASGAHEQGAVLGVSQSMSSLARAVGPLLAGACYDLHFAAPYGVGAALALSAGILLLRNQVKA